MLEYAEGDLLEADAEALVNTINCVGYMGKGIALQFKHFFPENFKVYKKACKAGNIYPGHVFIFETGYFQNPKFIINFPTKRHWRDRSRLGDIELGLRSLVKEIKRLRIKSIAIPPLGCGLGGLDWKEVKLLITRAFAELDEVHILLFEPGQAHNFSRIQPAVHTALPKMTRARAIFIKLIEGYRQSDYRLSLLEMQKLAYFLQETGEPLRLNYEHAPYGPYAHNLTKVLEVLEGHYIKGYVNTNLKPDAEIELVGDAIQVADKFLADDENSIKLLCKVNELIDGFETPYGLELLASVHWIAHNGDVRADNEESAVNLIHSWNQRKKEKFASEHIKLAWHHLSEKGWI